MASLEEILQHTISADPHAREAAQKYLEEAEQNNFPGYLVALAEQLSAPEASSIAKSAAGIALKNSLTTKEDAQREYLYQRWFNVDPDIRTRVKDNVLRALGTDSKPSVAAQCIAGIAAAEIPRQEWPELIKQLLEKAGSPDVNVRQASIEAVGYVCESVEPELLEEQSNDILNSVVHGMVETEQNMGVRFAAATALHNSLEFIRSNFDNKVERDFIMRVVCETSQCDNVDVQVAALMCLNRIMALYYDHMVDYIVEALFPITLKAMQNEDEKVAMQGTEFWSTVCDEEIELALEAEEAQQMQTQPSRVSQSFARGALEHLCPVLLQNLAKQDEEIDNQDWTVPAAASVCLMHLARCCGDVMLPHVIPYVAAHIQHQDWHLREAAVMAFGQCLEVTDSTDMPAYTAQILPVLLQLTSDSVLKVSDTAAWALGQICESVPQVVTTPEHLSMTVPVLLELLTSHPNIAGYAAWGLGSLCEATYEAALEALCEEAYNDEDIVVQDFAFSEVYERMVGALFATADRPDSGEFNLSTAVFEAIMTVIQHSAANCYPTIRQACEAVLERLENCVVQATQVIGHDDHMRLATFQGQLCATLQIILGKLSKEDALAVSDRVMTLLLSMFQTTSAKGHVEEDALLAITALINALEHDFIKYMDAFKPYLVLGLKNHQAHQVCSLAVGLVGDICRALGPDVVNYCEEFMRLLLDDVADPRLHRSVKPPILSAFGDIALAIGTLFQGNYLDVTMTVLQQASIVQAPDAMDYDTIEYLNRLRSACLEAYTSIVQGLKGVGNTPQPEVQVLLPYLTHMVKFVEFVAQDREHSEDVVQGALGLIGDLAESFGVTMQRYVDQNVMGAFLKQSRLSSSSQTTRLAEWATRTITKCLA